MTKYAFKQLVHRYLAGTASAEEREALERYYQLFAEEPDVLAGLDEAQLTELGARIRSRIPVAAAMEQGVQPRLRHIRWAVRVAVAAAVLAFISLGWWRWQDRTEADGRVEVVARKDMAENRFQLLPDSTRVVLQPGSQIAYSEQDGVREVMLTGQGWFDVAHRAQQPFVIRTGKVKTTVLGTAFTIKAWPGADDVTVSVIRGKVQVEDEQAQRMLAVLEADQQITYALERPRPVATLPVPAHETDWIKQDMTFDHMSMGELAGKLERRYGVRIQLANAALESCAITGRFSGTETLEEVLQVLAATSAATYRLQGDDVYIEGQGCN